MGEIRLVRDSSKFDRRAAWMSGTETETPAADINLKLHSAFEAVKCFPFKAIIFQFWRPVSDRGRLLLESCRNTDAFPPRPLLYKYRISSTRYHYSISNHDNHPLPDWIIRGGPVVAAFLNHFPEVVLDFKGSSPLLDLALECDLTCCVMLPVFYAESQCLGVVECSMKRPSLLLPVFNEIKRQLEKVGMTIYRVQGNWPDTALTISPPVKLEIEKALKMACESHRLTIAQVWTPYESENDKMFLVNLGRYSPDNSVSPVKDFYEKLDAVPLKRGEGLAGKTLQTHQPHLCRNICKLSDSAGLLALLSSNTKSASFVICLRSPQTGERDYLFDFFWPHTRNHLILLEALLSTLNKYLPNFKLVSGEQLGDELLVVDANNGSGYVKVCQGNEASNELRTMVGVKRKSIAGQSDSSQSNLEGDGVDDDLAILATYENETLLFDVPYSSTFENVMEKLKKEFELDPTRTYKVEFEVSPNRWSSLVSFESLKRKEGMDLIKLFVRPEGKQVGWRWITNTEG